MKGVKKFCLASAAFVREMARPRVKLEGYSKFGHEIASGWGGSPEARLIEKTERVMGKPKTASRLSLYCYDGPHSGEVFPLSKGTERFASDVDASVVLTPGGAVRVDSYRMTINGVINLVGENGSLFKVNGIQTERSEILDYDEVELLGNKFLVLVADITEAK